jgi:arylsulfatase A-like enzyme
MPFPRCKSNLYDSGARVPMAVRWPGKIPPGRQVTDFVSTTDLAPTFLTAAGLSIPDNMTGKSWINILKSEKSGRVEAARNRVFTGKERHVPCQEGDDAGGTPMRAIRTDGYLLIHNYRPDRWPSGTPNYQLANLPGCWLGDCDNGPTKTYMVENQNKDAEHQLKYKLAFGKRPEWELYDLTQDPAQLVNVAGDERYRDIKSSLIESLKAELVSTNDPRETDQNAERIFDQSKYFGSGPRHPSFSNKKKSKR